MNRTFKLVARHTKNQSSWIRGIPGRQAKKRVYTSEADFQRYAPETAERWKRFCGYQVEAYELVKDKWESISVP